MVHGGGLDPHWFDYPTLLMYLLAPFQVWQGAPSYLAARIVVLVLALGAIAASWWLGRRAYGVPAAAVAAALVAVEVTEVAYSRMAVTDVPLTLGVAASLALLVSGRIELAGLVAGLAMSIKYPGVFLLVPLAVASYREPRRLATGIGLAVVGFCATSPSSSSTLAQRSPTPTASSTSRTRAGSASSTTMSRRSPSSRSSGTAWGPRC